MNRLWYPAVASVLLCSGQAMAGNDFCDGGAGTWMDPSGPHSGSCEVNLLVGGQNEVARAPASIPELPRTRLLTFNQSVYGALGATPYDVQINFTICSANFGTYDASDKMASTLVKWLFKSDDPSQVGRVMALSLKRDGTALILNIDWLRSSGQAPTSASDILGSQQIKFGVMHPGATGFAQLPPLYLKRNGWSVSVGHRVKGGLTPVAEFQLPKGNWQPTHLANGFMDNTIISAGMKTHLAWPDNFAGVETPPPEPELPHPGTAE